MTARIYKPAKTAMQSGAAKTKEWVLEYEPEQPRQIEPLMGWTSSGDMRQQVQLRFESPEEAIAYFCTARLAAHSAMLASAAISAIITKKLAFAMLLQKPPRNPARMSAGN